ncbi:hypothetical protein [Variovorax gossypii]
MPQLAKADLHYTDYSWTVVPGDDPTKVKADADRLSRKEGYEVLAYLNSFVGPEKADLSKATRLIIEWIVHEKLPSDVQGRTKVTAWIVENFPTLRPSYPR